MILYIDPGTGSVIINFLIAIVTSIVYFFRKLLFKNINSDLKKKSEISIFSEGNQYKNTFLPIIDELISRKILFNYYTLDYKDVILGIESEFINSKFLGLGDIGKLKFSSVSSNILLSTTPNIGNKEFPLKRPKRVKELIHVWHSISDISYYKKGSLDNYDTVMTVGNFQNKSIKEIEKLRNLKSKKLVPVGLPYFDFLIKKLDDFKITNRSILIASSWGNKGLLKNHGLEIIDILKDYNIIIRPHPQSFISEKEFIENFKSICKRKSNIEWDESSNPLKSFSRSRLMISDTSSIRYDYSFLVGNPVITLKIEKSKLNEFEASDLNESWDEKTENQLGPVINCDDLNNLLNYLKSSESLKSHSVKKETLHTIGDSSKLIVNYISNQ
jgi:hypothetical protein